MGGVKNSKSNIELKKEKVLESINKKIEADAIAWNAKKYSDLEVDGEKLPEFPTNTMHYFIKSISSTPRNLICVNERNQNPIKTQVLLDIYNSGIEDITFSKVEVINNVLSAGIISDWGNNTEAILEDCVVLEKIQILYNKLYNNVSLEMQEKFNFLKSKYNQDTWDKIPTSKFHN